MNRRVYMLVCMVCMISVAGAQTSVHSLTRVQLDSIMNPTLHSGAEKVLRAERLSEDLGKLSEKDSPVSRTFRLRNVSGTPQRISRVRTTCGCTVAAYDTMSVAPDEEMQITLTYNPKNRPGTIDVDAFVYIRGEERQPMARLSLYGEVTDDDAWRHLPHTMGALRVKRREVHFSDLPVGGKPSMRILCANSGDKPLRLASRLLPSYVTFHTEPSVIAPGEEADMVITIDVSKLPKRSTPIRSSLIVEGVSGKPSARTLQLIIGE